MSNYWDVHDHATAVIIFYEAYGLKGIFMRRKE